MGGWLVLGWLAAEVSALVFVGRQVGLFWTLVAFFGTSALGLALLRYEGVRFFLDLFAWSQEVAEGERTGLSIPVADALPRLAGGMLLVLPGFVTDAIGVIVLLPPFRHWIRRWIEKQLANGWAERAAVFEARLRARHAASMQPEFDIEAQGHVVWPAEPGTTEQPPPESSSPTLELPPPNPRVQ